MNPSPNSLSYNLLKNGVTEDDLSKATSYQEKFGGRLELILVNLGYLDESSLAPIYSATLGLPLFDELTSNAYEVAFVDPVVDTKLLATNRWFLIKLGVEQALVTDNPLAIGPMQHVNQLANKLAVYVASPSQVEELARGYESHNESPSISVALDNIEEERLREMASEAPTVNLFNSIISKGLKLGASDIHFEPVNDLYRARVRVDGVLHELEKIPRRLNLPLISRIKILSGMDIAEKRRPQDGKIELKVSGVDLDIRVSSLPLNDGESMVLRLLKKTSISYEIESLGVSSDVLNAIQEDLSKTSGVVLLTGPTGSGKTTTLYTLLNELNDPGVKIITLEDPVEYQLDGVNQVQVNSDIGFDFSAGLRSIVRQDPDVIMLGEIRDKETSRIAMQSALTGHLVFSTVHTNDAPSAFTRLTDLGVEEFLLNAAIVSVIAQRLTRKLCSCSRAVGDAEQLSLVEKYNLQDIARRFDVTDFSLRTPVGCEDCGHTGYKGRMAIIEYLRCDRHLAALPKDETFLDAARSYNSSRGFRTLFEDGLYKALQGYTSIEEVIRVAG